MHTCPPSEYLQKVRPIACSCIKELQTAFDYISVLGTDSSGLAFSATPGELRVSDSRWIERGFVFRAQRNGRIAEYACTELPQTASYIQEKLDELLSSPVTAIQYPLIPDEPAQKQYFATIEKDPFTAPPESILSVLATIRDRLAAYSREIIHTSAVAEFMRVSKIFISPSRSLEQSFYWSQSYLIGLARRGNRTKEIYRSFSGLKGLELLDEMATEIDDAGAVLMELLDASSIEPGVYDVILDPDVSGTLAHEAFGHGVEMDMFVKKRARAAEYLGQPVASSIVQMFDGAADVQHCGSYLFDDEGQFSTTTQIIKDGILLTGISDTLSALKLGTKPTGNGRRQAYDHKAYARMTNTYFAPGNDTLDAMIKSIEYGWLLQKMNSGMEDPKNWGIQLIVLIGREIKNGKLTGKVVNPVVCSGYVPEVLSNITMISKDFELSGSGHCGKGYKEYVKVSAGGPYIKTKMRLG